MLFQLFWTYLKVGTFTLGGGYAMLPMIQHEVVNRRKWIDEEEFLNMIALAQAAPGLIAVNSAFFIGWRVGQNSPHSQSKLFRILCVLSTILGAILPSFVIILAIAILFSDYKSLPAVESIFKGIRPAVVALIASPLFRMAKVAGLSYVSALIPIAGALAIWLLGWSPVWLILLLIVSVIVYTWLAERRQR
jgi:chromate transporter